MNLPIISKKNIIIISVILILVIFFLSIYSFRYKLGFSNYKFTSTNSSTLDGEEIKKNYPAYDYAIVGNKSKAQCAIYLYDKSTRIELDNFSKENIYCDKVLRVGDSIVYRSASKYNEKEDKEVISKDWYYFNLLNNKKSPLFLSSEHGNATLETVILSEDSKYLFLATKAKVWVYTITTNKPELLKEIEFDKEVLFREKLIEKELTAKGFAISSYENLFAIGGIELNHQELVYKDHLQVGKNYYCDYKLIIDTSKKTYAEIVENCK